MGVTIIVPNPPSSRKGLVNGSKLQFSNEIPGNNQNFSENEMMRKLCGLIVIDCRSSFSLHGFFWLVKRTLLLSFKHILGK